MINDHKNFVNQKYYKILLFITFQSINTQLLRPYPDTSAQASLDAQGLNIDGGVIIQ